MCTPLFRRLVRPIVAAVLTACGGESLTLPGDGAPAGEGAPAALIAVSGFDQEGPVGSELGDPLVVRVTDSGTRPLPGVAVVFGFQSDVPGAEVDPTEAVTDAKGEASAHVRLGENAGSQTVEAVVAPASTSSLRATFALTAFADEEGGGGRGRGGRDEDDDD